MKQKYYAVKDISGYKKIFNSWDEVKEVISTLSKPSHKSFGSLEEAEAFLNDLEYTSKLDGPTAYIDGSYDRETESYSFGCVLLIDNKEYQFMKKYEKDEFSDMRNVAGEIKGAGFIMQYCVNHNIKKINICYDYIGIEKWYKKEWKASSIISIAYVDFCEKIYDKLEVSFHKIKSHSNNKYNDMADKLAKKALNIE